MIRRVATLLIALTMAALTSASPAFAGGNGQGAGSGGTVVQPDGGLHCC